MKKILLLLLITYMLFVTSVKADDFSQWSEVEPKGDNLIIESEIRYKYYMEYEVGEYLEKNSVTEYLYLNENNYIFTPWSTWQACVIDNNLEKEIRVVYPYQKLEYIRYFMITNVSEFAMVNQILVYYDGIRVYYNFSECDKCDSLFWTIESGGNMTFNILNNFDIDKLSFVISFNNSELIYYDLVLLNSINPNIKVGSISANSLINNYKVNENWINEESLWSEIIYSDVKMEENNFIKIYPSFEECRYREKLIYYYNIEKEYYSEEYYANLDDDMFIKDLNDYKIYYRYMENSIILEEPIIMVEPHIVEEPIIIDEHDHIIEKEIISLNEIEKIISSEAIVSTQEEMKINKKEEDISLINTLSLKKENIQIKFVITFVIFVLIISSLVIIKKLKRMSND